MKLIVILLAGFCTSVFAQTNARDAGTGQYVTKDAAKASPTTTVVEKVDPCSYKKPTKKQKAECKAKKAKPVK